MIKKLTKKRAALIGLIFLTSAGIFACSGGSSDSSTSSSPEITTLVTSANGVSNVTCAKNAQCIDYIFAGVAKMPTTLSQLATPWTDTSTNIMTISKIAYVEGSNDATVYSPQGSVFKMTINPLQDINGFPGQGTRQFVGNGLPNTPMGTFPVQSGTAAYPYYNALPGGTNPAGYNQATGFPSYVNAAAIGISPYPLESAVPLRPVPTGYYTINSLKCTK